MCPAEEIEVQVIVQNELKRNSHIPLLVVSIEEPDHCLRGFILTNPHKTLAFAFTVGFVEFAMNDGVNNIYHLWCSANPPKVLEDLLVASSRSISSSLRESWRGFVTYRHC